MPNEMFYYQLIWARYGLCPSDTTVNVAETTGDKQIIGNSQESNSTSLITTADVDSKQTHNLIAHALNTAYGYFQKNVAHDEASNSMESSPELNPTSSFVSSHVMISSITQNYEAFEIITFVVCFISAVLAVAYTCQIRSKPILVKLQLPHENKLKSKPFIVKA